MLAAILADAGARGAHGIYVVDSAGGMLPSEVAGQSARRRSRRSGLEVGVRVSARSIG